MMELNASSTTPNTGPNQNGLKTFPLISHPWHWGADDLAQDPVQMQLCMEQQAEPAVPRGSVGARPSSGELELFAEVYVNNYRVLRQKAPERECTASPLSIEIHVFHQQRSDTLCFCDSELLQRAHQSRAHKIRSKTAFQKSFFVQSV